MLFAMFYMRENSNADHRFESISLFAITLLLEVLLVNLIYHH
jgi:hypothetical protein